MVVPGGALASVFSAWGIASADIRHTFEREQTMRFPLHEGDVNSAFDELERAAHTRLDQDGVPKEQRVLSRSLEMHYAMQTNELGVAVPNVRLTDDLIEQTAAEFERGYERVYGKGSGFKEAGIEVTTFRVQALGRVSSIQIRPSELGSKHPKTLGSRPVYWPEVGERVSTPVYRGVELGVGAALEGPALIELPTTTVALHPSQRLRVDDLQNYLITEGA
jgi:N-methylhydantoinase A